jgi:hypothetical protein
MHWNVLEYCMNLSENIALNPEYWDYKLERDRLFSRLQRFRSDLLKENPSATNFDIFSQILLERYGVKIYLEGGGISTHYDVVNESAFTMFVLKYDNR